MAEGRGKNIRKLTPQQVYKIREIHREEPYVTQLQLASHFKVSVSTISQILTRRNWRDRG